VVGGDGDGEAGVWEKSDLQRQNGSERENSGEEEEKQWLKYEFQS